MSDSLFPDLGGEDRPADSTIRSCPKSSASGGASSFLAQQPGNSLGGRRAPSESLTLLGQKIKLNISDSIDQKEQEIIKKTGQ